MSDDDENFDNEAEDAFISLYIKDLTQIIFDKFLDLEVYFYNSVNYQEEKNLLSEVFVINSFHELIIGRIPMCKHDLWNKLRADTYKICNL